MFTRNDIINIHALSGKLFERFCLITVASGFQSAHLRLTQIHVLTDIDLCFAHLLAELDDPV